MNINIDFCIEYEINPQKAKFFFYALQKFARRSLWNTVIKRCLHHNAHRIQRSFIEENYQLTPCANRSKIMKELPGIFKKKRNLSYKDQREIQNITSFYDQELENIE